MLRAKVGNKCRRIRALLNATVSRRFGPDAGWLQDHVARCPRCRRRLVSRGKVNLAISFLKTQPHGLDLLMRANTQAIRVLKHSLRSEPQAQKLRKKLPEPKPLEVFGKYGHTAANTAACLAILLLMKIGVLSSMDQFHSEGRKTIRQYYTTQVGADLADDVFT